MYTGTQQNGRFGIGQHIENKLGMASSIGFAVPKPLQDSTAKSWFKHFQFCAAANKLNTKKQLLRLPPLIRSKAWAIFDSLSNNQRDTYTKLKTALLKRLSPEMDKARACAHDELTQRRLCDGERVGKLAKDIEKLLEMAFPGLPADVRETELHFHLTAAFPEKIAFQLKLLSKLTYDQTIMKVWELCLTFQLSRRVRLTLAILEISA